MYVCLCNGVTDRQLVEAAAELALQTGTGSDSSFAEQIADRLGAGLGCGTCRDFAIDLVERAAAKQVSVMLPERGRASSGLDPLPGPPARRLGVPALRRSEGGHPRTSRSMRRTPSHADTLRAMSCPSTPGIPLHHRARTVAPAIVPTGLILAAVVTAAPAAPSPAERAAILAPASRFDTAERWERLPGGSTTNRRRLDRNRVLAAVGQHHLRSAGRIRDRQRPVPPAVGVGAQLHPQRRRSRTAVQRPCVPALPPEGRTRPSAGKRAGQRGVDAAPALGAAPHRCGTRPTRRGPRGGHPRAHLRDPAPGRRGSGPCGGRQDSGSPAPPARWSLREARRPPWRRRATRLSIPAMGRWTRGS